MPETQTQDYTADGQADVNSPEISESGKIENKAISSAYQALAIARTFQRDDEKRDLMRARVLAAYNGEAPFCEDELIAAAQAYRCNVSFGFMEGSIGRGTVPYNDLVSDNQYVANIKGDLPESRLNIIRNELTQIIDKWGEWQKFTSRLINDLVLNGWNNAIFPSTYDPWPVFISQKHGFVHEMTPNSVKDLDVFVWKKDYLIHELYAKIQDEKAAKAAGWNIDNARKALEQAAPQYLIPDQREGGFTKFQEILRGGTLYASMVGGKIIKTYHVFAAELNGEVSHWIVLDDGQLETQNAYNPQDPALDNIELFKKEDRFKRMEDILVYFDLEPGDGLWHGSRGLGRRLYNTHRAIDKERCAIIDQSHLQGLALIQVADQSSQEDFTFVVAGPFAVIPPGVTVQPSGFPTIPSTVFQADALLSATSEQRVGDVMPSAQAYDTNSSKTATQAKIEEGRKAAISKSNLQRFLDPLSALMSIMVRRLLMKNSPDPYAKEFQARLKAQGFTQDELEKIAGARSTGRIDQITGNDAQAMQVVFAEFRGDPDVPQKDLKRRRISSLLGPKDAEDLVPDSEDIIQKGEAERQQKAEISSLLAGIPLEALAPDNHKYHLPIILEWLSAQLEGLEKNGQGAELTMLEEGTKHAADHLAYLSTDKTQKALIHQATDAIKKIKDKIKELSANFQKNQAQAAQQEQMAQAAAQGQLPALQEPQLV